MQGTIPGTPILSDSGFIANERTRLAAGFNIEKWLELTDQQLLKLLSLLSKTVWYEEGLDESREKCLDDLLIYADK